MEPKPKSERFSALSFRHAIRYELYPTNPIADVRQVRKRATDPSTLEPEEIGAILRELERAEPVRTAFLDRSRYGYPPWRIVWAEAAGR